MSEEKLKYTPKKAIASQYTTGNVQLSYKLSSINENDVISKLRFPKEVEPSIMASPSIVLTTSTVCPDPVSFFQEYRQQNENIANNNFGASYFDGKSIPSIKRAEPQEANGPFTVHNSYASKPMKKEDNLELSFTPLAKKYESLRPIVQEEVYSRVPFASADSDEMIVETPMIMPDDCPCSLFLEESLASDPILSQSLFQESAAPPMIESASVSSVSSVSSMPVVTGSMPILTAPLAVSNSQNAVDKVSKRHSIVTLGSQTSSVASSLPIGRRSSMEGSSNGSHRSNLGAPKASDPLSFKAWMANKANSGNNSANLTSSATYDRVQSKSSTNDSLSQSVSDSKQQNTLTQTLDHEKMTTVDVDVSTNLSSGAEKPNTLESLLEFIECEIFSWKSIPVLGVALATMAYVYRPWLASVASQLLFYGGLSTLTLLLLLIGLLYGRWRMQGRQEMKEAVEALSWCVKMIIKSEYGSQRKAIGEHLRESLKDCWKSGQWKEWLQITNDSPFFTPDSQNRSSESQELQEMKRIMDRLSMEKIDRCWESVEKQVTLDSRFRFNTFMIDGDKKTGWTYVVSEEQERF